MTEKEMLLNLVESLEAAQSSIKAAEKWAQKLGDELDIPLSKAEKLAQENSKHIASDHDEEARIIEAENNK